MNEIFKELAHLNVLLVEDDTQLQGVLAGLLAPYVRQIYKAQNGQEGFECFSKNDIDVIITDINMTHMSGTTMAKRVRELDARVSIIFITAYDTDENLQNSLNIQIQICLKSHLINSSF